jgi:hypothetical protein
VHVHTLSCLRVSPSIGQSCVLFLAKNTHRTGVMDTTKTEGSGAAASSGAAAAAAADDGDTVPACVEVNKIVDATVLNYVANCYIYHEAPDRMIVTCRGSRGSKPHLWKARSPDGRAPLTTTPPASLQDVALSSTVAYHAAV